MKNLTVAVTCISFILAFAACHAREPQPTKSKLPPPVEEKGLAPPETVTFTTDDDWELTATYWPAGAPGKPAAVLLHMLPADRHSYDDFGPKLAAAGFNVLAVDSRGHGDSLTHAGGKEEYSSFDDAAYNASVKDVAAAKRFLKDKGADVKLLVCVGASIGANFALRYAAADPDVRGIVLLSPGLDYHGVKTEDAMAAYGNRPCFLVASDEDAAAADCIKKLKTIAPGADYKMFHNAGHGTNIFRAEPKLEGELVDWLRGCIK